jgi:hypothetical protein
MATGRRPTTGRRQIPILDLASGQRKNRAYDGLTTARSVTSAQAHLKNGSLVSVTRLMTKLVQEAMYPLTKLFDATRNIKSRKNSRY